MSALPGAGVPVEPYWRRALWWRRTGLASASFWAATVVAFLGTVVAARGLGPADYGVVVLALAAGAVLTTFLDISLEDALVFFGSRKLALGQRGLRALFRFAARLDLVLGLLVAAALVLEAELVAELFTGGKVDPDLVRLGVLAAAVATVDGTTGAALVVARRPELRGWAQLVRALLRVVLLVPALLWGGVAAVLWAFVAASAGGSVLQGYLAWSRAWRSWPADDDADRTPAGPLIRFAALSSLTGSVAAASTAVLPLLLVRLFDARAVGLFTVAAAPLLFAGLLSAPLRLALMPEQTERLARGSGSSGRRDLGRLVVVAVAASLVTVVAGWLLLPWAVPLLFGGEYVDAVPLALVIVVGVLGVNVSSAAKLFVLAAGRAGVRAAMSGLELVTVLGAVTVAAQVGGLRGAAVGYAGSLVAISCVWCVVAVTIRSSRQDQPSHPPS